MNSKKNSSKKIPIKRKSIYLMTLFTYCGLLRFIYLLFISTQLKLYIHEIHEGHFWHLLNLTCPYHEI